jgi:hypothetical protein
VLGGLLLVAAAAVLAATGLLTVAALGVELLPARICGAAVVAYGTLVLLAELLSFPGWLGRAGWLAGEVVALAAAVAFWHRQGRPPLWTLGAPATLRQRARAAAGRHPAEARIAGVACVALLVQFVMGLVSAPSNWDTMAYHLSRAAYWLQDGAALRFDGGTIRQLSSPPNAEMAVAWTMAMSGTDVFIELVQWTALVVAAIAVAGLARVVGASRAQAAVAAAIYVVLPGPLLESLTAQNDLVVSACILSAMLLGAHALRLRDVRLAALAGVAFGLALGTKGTTLFALPAIGLLFGAVALRARAGNRIVAALAVCLVVGGVVFGASGYVQNLAATGSPFGGINDQTGRKQWGVAGNGLRVVWNFVDSPGVALSAADAVFDKTVQPFVGSSGSPVDITRVGTTVHEDAVAGGLVGWLVLWPLVLVVFFRRKSRLEERAVAAGALLFVAIFALLIGATSFNGRVLNPSLALAAPLIALTARRDLTLGAVTVLATLSMVPALLTNDSHPVLSSQGPPEWGRDRIDQMSIGRFAEAPFLRKFDQVVPAQASVLVIGGEDAWDYPLFGEHRTRRLVRVTPGAPPRDNTRLCGWLVNEMRRTGTQFAVFLDVPAENPAPPPSTNPILPVLGEFLVPAANVRAGCGPARPS